MFTQKVILDFEKKVETLFVRKNENEQSFDTFFNSLNLYLIKHYTDGNKLTIKLDYVGNSPIKVIHAYKNETKVLYECNHLEKEIEVDLSSLGELGIIYPVFNKDVQIKSMTYEVNATSRDKIS